MWPTRPSRSPARTAFPASPPRSPGRSARRPRTPVAAQDDVVAEDARQPRRRERDRVDQTHGRSRAPGGASHARPSRRPPRTTSPVHRRVDRRTPRVALPRPPADEQAAPATGRMGVEPGPLVDAEEVVRVPLAEHVDAVTRDAIGGAGDRDPALATQREVDHDGAGEPAAGPGPWLREAGDTQRVCRAPARGPARRRHPRRRGILPGPCRVPSRRCFSPSWSSPGARPPEAVSAPLRPRDDGAPRRSHLASPTRPRRGRLSSPAGRAAAPRRPRRRPRASPAPAAPTEPAKPRTRTSRIGSTRRRPRFR